MKTKLLLFIALFTVISLAQSLRVGVSYGVHKLNEQQFKFNNSSDFKLNMDNDKHYGLKLKLALPVINLSGYAYKYSDKGSIQDNFFGQLNYELDYWVLGAGIEMTLLPGPVNPYIAGDLILTTSQDVKLGGMTLSNLNGTESKIGVGLGAGVDIKILPIIDLDFNVKYNMHNLIKKEDGELNYNTFNATLSVLIRIL